MAKTVHHRRSIRLRGHDYSSDGAYFVTVCARDRACLFGDIVDDEMRMNDAGRIVRATWDALGDPQAGVSLDAFVVMPNHIHGVVVIRRRVENHVGAIHESPPPRIVADHVDATPTSVVPAERADDAGAIRESPLHRRRMSIPLLVGRFKMASAKQINLQRATPGVPVWQRNYFEHIVRDAESLDRIRSYIADNPRRWADDPENVSFPGA